MSISSRVSPGRAGGKKPLPPEANSGAASSDRPSTEKSPQRIVARGPQVTAAVLSIGDEVVCGEVVNANAAYLSERLFEAGVVLREQTVVPDDPQAIRAALERLRGSVDVLIATGGLGPTEDDRTVDAVAELLGVSAEPHAASLDAMKKRFSAHGFELTPNNLRQVRVPAGAEALSNGAGIAPGFRIRLGGADAYFLPGVPREMEKVFADHVAPRLATVLKTAGVAPAIVRTWHVYGMGESHIDHRLAGLLDGVTGATLHFRTAAPENHVKVIVRGPTTKSKELMDKIEGDLRKRIGNGIYGIDGETFPWAVGKALREAAATMAIAESCTGGYAGQLITAESGASDVFLGSVVCYANDVKVNVLGVKAKTIEEFGAVSEPCAREMAEGVKRICNSTVGIAITGVAGADREGGDKVPKVSGPTPSEKPVGTVSFAIAGPKTTRAETKLFTGGRERIRRAAAYYAIDLARRQFSK